MTILATKEDFEAMLRADKAIVFVFYDWSGPAHMSKPVVEHWEAEWRALHPSALVGFYFWNPDKFKDDKSWRWLGEQPNGAKEIEGGNGSVLWICNGHSVGYVSSAIRTGKDKLSLLTQQYFGSPNEGTGSHLNI
ncbi:MAG TPA: hypothetical protein VHB20_17780 [Verrucomicrobiae bacterium]|jgi:hypothetical protein|nr:hypothetical protein [Verrucomicrobiae bacterium]